MRCNESKRDWRSGFTLIELLVVIAIIAILAAILFPVFAQAREKARTINCTSNTKQMSLAYTMYLQDYDEVLPYWLYRSPNYVHRPGEPPTPWVFFDEYLKPYTKNDQIWRCAAAARTSSIRLSDLPPGSIFVTDYGVLAGQDGGRGTQDCPYVRMPFLPSPNEARLAEVSRPAEIIVFMDGSLGIGTSGGQATSALTRFFIARHHPIGPPDRPVRTTWSGGCPVFITTDDPNFNPNSRMNVAFMDGHSKLVNRDWHMGKTNLNGVWHWTHMTIDR